MGVVRYLDLAEWIRVRSPRAGPSRIVAIDGPAGSGKSVFAARLAHVLTAPVICALLNFTIERVAVAPRATNSSIG